MPQPPTLKINEVFASIQGEGLRQGEPTIFIRATGCNLRCTFCDTTSAWEQGEEKTPAEILQEVRRIRNEFPAYWICITGGEPLQQDLSELAHSLKAEGMQIQVETNGTLYQDLPVDWYTVSPKPEHFLFKPEYKNLAKEIKIIVTSELDFATVVQIRQAFPEQVPILLQPESNLAKHAAKGLEFIKQSLQAGYKNMRVSVQLHKIYSWK